jgi:integrase
MFTIAIQDGKLFAKPYIPKLEEPKARKGFVTDEEYTAIRDALEPHMRGVWAFQFLTGWRSTEVLGLKWEHINGDQIRFTEQTKGDEAARPFPISPAIKRVLDDQKKLIGKTKTPFVFCFVKGKKRAGRQISYNGWLHAFNDARDAVAVRKTIIPHDCRRTAIDRMERLGVARSTAMVMVGHKTESVYRRYAITSARTLEDAGAKLAGIKLPAPARKR